MPIEVVTCPTCASTQTCRTVAHSLRERLRKRFTKKRLYRCRDCNWRGFVVPSVLHHSAAEWTWQTDSISLTELDAQLNIVNSPKAGEGEPKEPVRERPTPRTPQTKG